jgi:hypothetical protein
MGFVELPVRGLQPLVLLTNDEALAAYLPGVRVV